MMVTKVNASQIGYMPAGTGAVATTVQSKLQETTVSVKEFGAVLDGVTNDATALFNANAAAVAARVPLLILGVMHIGTAITITAPIVDGVHQMFSTTSSVTIANGLPVRPEWFGSTAGSIKRAVESFPASGGVVLLRPIRYPWSGYGGINTNFPVVPPQGSLLTKANISIIGDSLPVFYGDRLINGSVIEGPFGVYANNFYVDKVGFDSGEYVCNKDFGGISQDGFQATYHTGISNSSPYALGLRIGKIIGVTKSSSSPQHACLIERYQTVDFDTIISINGVHGTAIKSVLVRGKQIDAYQAGGNGVIFKSDGIALGYMSTCNDVDIGLIRSIGTTSNAVTIQAGDSTGSPIASINIGKIVSNNSSTVTALYFLAETASAIFDNINIQNLEATGGAYSVAQNLPAMDIRRLHIGRVVQANVSNIGVQLDLKSKKYPASIGEILTTNVQKPVVLRSSALLKLGKIIDDLSAVGCISLIDINDSSVVHLGDHAVDTVPVFENNKYISILNGWIGGSSLYLDIKGGRFWLTGYLARGSATSDVIAQLAAPFRPAAKRFITIGGQVGTDTVALLLMIEADGTLRLAKVPAGLDFISFDNVSWY